MLKSLFETFQSAPSTTYVVCSFRKETVVLQQVPCQRLNRHRLPWLVLLADASKGRWMKQRVELRCTQWKCMQQSAGGYMLSLGISSCSLLWGTRCTTLHFCLYRLYGKQVVKRWLSWKTYSGKSHRGQRRHFCTRLLSSLRSWLVFLRPPGFYFVRWFSYEYRRTHQKRQWRLHWLTRSQTSLQMHSRVILEKGSEHVLYEANLAVALLSTLQHLLTGLASWYRRKRPVSRGWLGKNRLRS